ncbi:50S ribosomal protein L40e [Candidatus Woesearchaeota archaeon]|nr:50S ribosomal protein L40e [Candidatus Woesearchaeota archaeon]
MVKFPEASARLFKNIYVCRKCKSKIRASPMKVLAGKVKCRKCKGKFLRPVRKK